MVPKLFLGIRTVRDLPFSTTQASDIEPALVPPPEASLAIPPPVLGNLIPAIICVGKD